MRLTRLFPAGAGRALWFHMVASSALAILDILALGLMAISLNAMITNADVHIPGIGTITPAGYGWILLAICLLIIGKSVLAMSLQWFTTRRMARYELAIGNRLFISYIHTPWIKRLSRNSTEVTHLADAGVAAVMGGFVLQFIAYPSIFTTSAAVVLVLAIAQPLTAVISVIYLGFVAFLLNTVISKRLLQAARVRRTYGYKVSALLTDMTSAMKEITLRNELGSVAEVLDSNRIHLARARSNLSFLGTFPKFVLDGALVGGILLVGGAAFITGGAPAAISAVAIFGIAGVRLIPAMTGLQSTNNLLKSNAPYVDDLIREIEESKKDVHFAETVGKDPLPESPRALTLNNVSFSYSSHGKPALKNVNLTVPLGTTLGIVGSSGAGKSTLVDLLLGLLTPSKGEIKIDDANLVDVLASWRSRVGYVPQQVALFDGSIAQNVALTWNNDIDYAQVKKALTRAQLWSAVSRRPNGMDDTVGDRGLSLSGGQRQRIGIARALYTDPLVLVMDEATSALDTKTESQVSSALEKLDKNVTLVLVAHRLSTIRNCDQICFMKDGTVKAVGTFDELVASEPEFAEQAKLASL